MKWILLLLLLPGLPGKKKTKTQARDSFYIEPFGHVHATPSDSCVWIHGDKMQKVWLLKAIKHAYEPGVWHLTEDQIVTAFYTKGEVYLWNVSPTTKKKLDCGKSETYHQ